MNVYDFVDKPIEFGRLFWPKLVFYDKQEEIILSVRDNYETYVPAANRVGKSCVAAFIALWFFLTRSPCRVVTTSADFDQLRRVLWGEIDRLLQTSVYPLDAKDGGILAYNFMDIHKVVGGRVDEFSYLIGRTAAKGEGLQGHHAFDEIRKVYNTLGIVDEASGVDDINYDMIVGWAGRLLALGNPIRNKKGPNWFEKNVKAGDLITAV
jgi:hypothetical protein